METLRILQVYEIGPKTGSYSAEGVGSIALEVSKRLARKGHEMWVLTGAAPGAARAEEIDGVHVERAELAGTMRATWSPTNLKFTRQSFFPLAALKDLGRFRGFDIYHGHIYSASIAALALGRLWGGRVVTMIHGSYYPIWDEIVGSRQQADAYRIAERALATFLAKRGDAQIHTANYFARMVRDWGAPPGRLHIVNCGIDADRFSPTARPTWRPRCCQFMLLSARRLVKKNGLEYLIRSMPEIRRNWGAHLVIAGDGPERKGLEGLAAEIGVKEHVSFLGLLRNEEIPGLLSACDVAIIPSLIEAPGLFLLEAMAAAKAVVATGVGSIPEVVDGENGVIVPPRRPREIAEAVSRLLSDAEERTRIGLKARRTVESDYTIEAMSDSILGIYRAIL